MACCLPSILGLLLSRGWRFNAHAVHPPLDGVASAVSRPLTLREGGGGVGSSGGGDLGAVYVYGLAADPVGLFGAEEGYGVGDVGGGAWAAHWDVGF